MQAASTRTSYRRRRPRQRQSGRRGYRVAGPVLLLSLLVFAPAGTLQDSAGLLQAPANQQWKTATFSFYASRISAADILLDFSTNLSVPVTVSPGARQQTVNGNFRRLPGRKFIELLCKANSLTWFFDGSMLFVRHVNELARKDLTLDPDTFDAAAFTRHYGSFGIDGGLNRVDVIFDGQVMRLTGLPEYIRFVENIVRFVEGDKTVLEQGAGFGEADAPVVRMLPVRHAYSEAQLVNLANVLARTMGVNRIDLADAGTAQTAMPQGGAAEPEPAGTLGGLFGSGLSSKNVEPVEQYGRGAPAPEAGPAAAAASGAPAQGVVFSGAAPFVAVNVSQRALIVRDLRTRIPQYQRLLNELDVPERQIEISASILDVNSNFNSQLGVNIQNNQEQGLLEYEYIPATSISDITGFRARLFALVEDGNARVVSEPSILTLNNRAAQFKTDQTFYVRLAGDRAVDLIPISFGTRLQVTPNIVGGNNGGGDDTVKIHLDIHIEDGVRANPTGNVDAIPPVNNTVIDTEALVQQDTSLLVGGYQINDEDFSDSGIPILKDIPFLGLLFSTRSRVISSINRYFIINTRVLDYDTPEGVQQEDEKANAALSQQ
ncbi:MAG: hypothetical protein OXI88_02625 [Gammaproteobacteria bacterium]|nr:hypothetical protein [Gammaproteobacteria bacterium]MDE0282995.1 hypothetical protein [Gammaproteobacteria bacterium]MDE0510666.1 hypothetical protein [Gammaproteobacteria bacterium]